MLGTFKCSLVSHCARSNGLTDCEVEVILLVPLNVIDMLRWNINVHIYEYIQELVFMLPLRFGDVYYDLL